jgi:signal peptidase II
MPNGEAFRVTTRLSIPISAVLVAIGVVIADQLSKWGVMRVIGPDASRQERWIAGDWLGLAYGENSGIAFGLMRGSSPVVLTAAGTAGIAAIGWLIWTHRAIPLVQIAGGLIAGGAIGNLIDRVRFGHVRDFVAVGIWPSFNLADSAITAGAVIAAVAIWRSGRESVHVSEPPDRSPRTALDVNQ